MKTKANTVTKNILKRTSIEAVPDFGVSTTLGEAVLKVVCELLALAVVVVAAELDDPSMVKGSLFMELDPVENVTIA